MKTPNSIKPHAPKFKDGSWKEYTLMELGNWVHLFCKRAEHRADEAKAEKDLTDAQNYLNMMQSHIDDVRARVALEFKKQRGECTCNAEDGERHFYQCPKY